MKLKILSLNEVSAFLGSTSLIAYTDPFASFISGAYSSQRSFVGIFESETLKAFFPVFQRIYRGQKTAEAPIFIYTDIFLIDNNFVVKGGELGKELQKFLKADVLRLNLYNLYLSDRTNINYTGFDHIFTAMIADLRSAQSYEEYLQKILSKNARSKIYKAYQSGLELVWLNQGDLPEFHRLYSDHVRMMGSKPHPLEYFKKMLEAYTLGENLFMMGAKKDKKLVTANLFVTNKDYMEVRFLADELESRHLFPNNFLYAEMIKWAYAHGIRWIDFGGIPKTMQTNINFKKSLGAKEYPIYTKYFFRNWWQKMVFKVGIKILYWKKYRRAILDKFKM